MFDFGWTLRSNEALLKDQWSVFGHIALAAVLLSFLIDDDVVHLVDWLEFLSFQLGVHTNDLSRLLRHNIVQLAGKILGREAEL